MSGYLHEDTRQLYHKTELSRRGKLRAELSGLHGDVDMMVYDGDRKPITSDHRRTGTDPEVFERTLPAGEYTIALTRKSGTGTMTPFDLAVFQEEPDELTVAELEAAKRNAYQLVAGSGPREFQFDDGIAYFYFDPPRSLAMYSVRFSPSIRGPGVWTIEDENGRPLISNNYTFLVAVPHTAGPSSGRTYLRVVGNKGTAERLSVTLASRGGLPKRSSGWVSDSGTVKDWSYGIREDRCIAYSHAKDIQPASGWLDELPMMSFQVVRGQNNRAFIQVASGDDFDPTAATNVRISNSRGTWRAVKLVWDGPTLKPVSYSKKQKQYTLNSSVIRAMRAGSFIEISGASVSGKPVRAVYSLAGVTAATNRIIRLCGLRGNVFKR